MTSTNPSPSDTRPGRITWGIPDALGCWLAGYLGATLAGFALSASLVDSGFQAKLIFGFVIPSQQLSVILAAVYVSRLKGQRSLGRDFGFVVRWRDATYLLAGAFLEVALSLALLPILKLDPDAENQQLLSSLKEHRDVPTVALFVIGAVVLAPIVEELLFRGVLLRALLRRFTPAYAVLGSGTIFAFVHYVGDPNTLPFLPALAGLGVVLAIVAHRTGNLSAPIFIHAGFNLTTTVLFLMSGL